MAEINEENIVKHKNLYYDKNRKKYTVSMNVKFKSLNKHKLVYLGAFENPNDAIKLIELAKEKIRDGIFEEWYARFYKSSIRKVNKNLETKNIFYDKNSKKYKVIFNIKSKNTNKRKSVYLGAYENIEDAIKLVDLANKKKIEGNFEDWSDNYREELPRKKMTNNKKKTRISSHHDDMYIYFLKDSKKWQVTLSYNNKQRLIGRFSDKHEAKQARDIAIEKINEGLFEEWYEEFKKNLSLIKKFDMNDEQKYIYYHTNLKKWQVKIWYTNKQYVIGTFDDKTEAVQLRNLAIEKINDGTFDDWYNSYKSKKTKGGVYEIDKSQNKKWMVKILFNKKMYYLGSFNRKDEAEDVYNYAKSLREDEFISWYEKHRLIIVKRKKSKYPGIYKLTNKYQVQASYNGKTYSLGSYEHLSDAVNVRKEAEKHKENGDFIEWHIILRKYNKEENQKKGNGVYKSNDPVLKWSAYIQFNGTNYYLGSFKYKKDAAEIYNYAKKLNYDQFLEWYNKDLSKQKFNYE